MASALAPFIWTTQWTIDTCAQYLPKPMVIFNYPSLQSVYTESCNLWPLGKYGAKEATDMSEAPGRGWE